MASTGRMRTDPSRTGALMAMTSMLCVQLGLAASVGLVDRIGPEGAAWLRLSWSGLLLLLVVRPRREQFSRAALVTGVCLGVTTAAIALAFMAAVARLPLGTASALEFLGPLAVAVAHGRGVHRMWAALAGVGVVLLTRPWSGGVDPVGVACALAAAVGWAAYILLTRRVGDQVAGIAGLAVSMPVAGLVATLVVGPSVPLSMTPGLLLTGLGLALLLPVVPFTLELLALRRLTTAAFGTMMSLEPALALVIGLVALGQVPSPLAVLGVGFVVVAGVGAERTGARSAVVPVPGPAGPSARPEPALRG